MNWRPAGTEWSDYYKDTNYSHDAMNHKQRLVEAYLSESKPHTVWDLGANTGVFSRIAAAKNIDTIAFDVDPAAVEKNYRQMRENKETKILPLCLDLTNPSPAIGWANEERLSLIERGPADTVLALALIHHLAISNNVPFSHIAAFLSQICRFLIIEFVSKNDSQVQRLLRSREDIFPDYNQDHFEAAFGDFFSIRKRERIADTERTLYLIENKNAD
jgi:ribosomal protein L11 methylase PrmA